jgi:hyperosmotically inducible protein
VEGLTREVHFLPGRERRGIGPCSVEVFAGFVEVGPGRRTDRGLESSRQGPPVLERARCSVNCIAEEECRLHARAGLVDALLSTVAEPFLEPSRSPLGAPRARVTQSLHAVRARSPLPGVSTAFVRGTTIAMGAAPGASAGAESLMTLRRFGIGFVSAAMLALSGGIARADRPDAWITTKVKWQLLTDDRVRGSDINVDTTDRRVTLHGRVRSEDERRRAEEDTRGIEGVREIRNLLVVAPLSQRSDEGRANDRQLRDRVREALSNDATLQHDEIRVKSANRGTVVLAGNAASTYEHERAIRIAYSVPGVDRVASEIQSPNQDADLEIWRAAKTDDGPRNPAAWDPMLTTRVKLKLLASDEVPGLDVNVDTTDGVVTLFGTVPTEQSKQVAEREATSVKGVARVKNEIEVVPDPRREEIEARDKQAESRVKQRLEAEPSLEDQHVKVEVRDGVARLTGEVDADYQRLAALVAARTTEGITKVVDDVEVSAQRAGRDD